MIVEDLQNTFPKFGFALKTVVLTGDNEPPQKIMGFLWDPVQDTIKLTTNIFPMNKNRGAYTGEPLSLKSIPSLVLNREMWARCQGQLYDLSGVFVSIPLARMKIVFSKLTTRLGGDDWRTPISSTDQDLYDECCKVLGEL